MNCLFFIDNVKNINSVHNNKYSKVWIMTNNCNIKRLADSDSKINECIFIDSDEPIDSASVWNIIDNINNIIRQVIPKNECLLYELSYLIEGGPATEIANILFYIKIISKYMSDKDVDCLASDVSGTAWSYAAELIAKSYGKYFICMESNVFLNIKDCSFAYRLREIRLLIKRIIAKYKGDNFKNKTCDIWFINEANSNKRIQWISDRINDYLKKFDYSVICINSAEASRCFSENNINSINIDGFFCVYDWIISVIQVNGNINIIKRVIEGLDIKYLGVDISALCGQIALRHIKKNTIRYKLDFLVVDRFVKYNDAKLVTGLGDTNFKINRIFFDRLKFYNKNTLFFKEEAGNEVLSDEYSNIFEPYSNMFQIRLMSPKSVVPSILRLQGWKGRLYKVARSGIEKSYDSNERDIQKKISVLWAPSDPFIGTYSLSSFWEDNISVFEKAKNVDCQLYIKYHPNQKEEQLEALKKYWHGKIHYISKNKSIIDYINFCDAVITTPSMVILDSLKMHRFVTCLVTDNTYRFVKYMNDGIQIVNREQLDLNKIVSICSSQNVKEYRKIIKRQDRFLKEYFYPDCEENVEDILRREIMNL